MNSVIKKLNERRKELNWNYVELSKQSGISETCVRTLMQGKQPLRFDIVIHIAFSLGYKIVAKPIKEN